jgi:prepilin-type N-terminal cleavage/methylation domain-containing protein
MRPTRWLQAEDGMTLIELLIAMVVMAIGISAIVAGFSSGILAVNRARVTSTAGALADQQMELYRQAPFTSVPVRLPSATTPTGPTTTPTGPDGHKYWMQVDGAWSCAVGTYSEVPPGSCFVPPASPASRPVKLVTITVRDGSATARLLFSESATFDSSTG